MVANAAMEFFGTAARSQGILTARHADPATATRTRHAQVHRRKSGIEYGSQQILAAMQRD